MPLPSIVTAAIHAAIVLNRDRHAAVMQSVADQLQTIDTEHIELLAVLGEAPAATPSISASVVPLFHIRPFPCEAHIYSGRLKTDRGTPRLRRWRGDEVEYKYLKGGNHRSARALGVGTWEDDYVWWTARELVGIRSFAHKIGVTK